MACVLPAVLGAVLSARAAHAQSSGTSNTRYLPGGPGADGYAAASVNVSWVLRNCDGALWLIAEADETSFIRNAVYWYKGKQYSTLDLPEPDHSNVTVRVAGRVMRNDVTPVVEFSTAVNASRREPGGCYGAVYFKELGSLSSFPGSGATADERARYVRSLSIEMANQLKPLRSVTIEEAIEAKARRVVEDQERARQVGERERQAAQAGSSRQATSEPAREAGGSASGSAAQGGAATGRTTTTGSATTGSERTSSGGRSEPARDAARDAAREAQRVRDSVAAVRRADAERDARQQEAVKEAAAAAAPVVLAAAQAVGDAVSKVADGLSENYGGYTIGVSYMPSPFARDEDTKIIGLSQALADPDLFPSVLFFDLGLLTVRTCTGCTRRSQASMMFHAATTIPQLSHKGDALWAPTVGLMYVLGDTRDLIRPTIGVARVGRPGGSLMLRAEYLVGAPTTTFNVAIGFVF